MEDVWKIWCTSFGRYAILIITPVDAHGIMSYSCIMKAPWHRGINQKITQC